MKKLLASAAIILSIGSANAASAQVGTATLPEPAELKSVGGISLKRHTAIGCYDIRDTLNPRKARRLADLADQIMSSDSLDDWEQIKCQEFSNQLLGVWDVPGQSLPQLPLDKVALCVDSSAFVVGDHPTTRCMWIITDKTNIYWYRK